jgi:hypothetical protein
MHKDREKRWIVLADDGLHVTIGRHTDPSEDEIVRAGDALTPQFVIKFLNDWLFEFLPRSLPDSHKIP